MNCQGVETTYYVYIWSCNKKSSLPTFLPPLQPRMGFMLCMKNYFLSLNKKFHEPLMIISKRKKVSFSFSTITKRKVNLFTVIKFIVSGYSVSLYLQYKILAFLIPPPNSSSVKLYLLARPIETPFIMKWNFFF